MEQSIALLRNLSAQYISLMAKTAKTGGTRISRTSDSGRFVVAKQATKSKRFSDGVLRDAVRKVNAAKASSRS